jgi:hypothetical protein
MTVYTTVPLDDSNLDVTVTESADLVSIDIKPASFTGSGGGGGGAVSSVNTKVGTVVLDTDDIGEGTTNEYYTDARAQTLINTLPIAYTNADLTMSGNIIPSIDSDGTTGYDLGSPTKKWKDLYLSEGSLYIDNQKVIESQSGTIVVTADTDQSLKIDTTGTGVLTLSSATTVNVDSTLQMGAGFKITTVNGDPVEFGDKLNLDNNQIINLAGPTAASHATNKTYVDTAFFNLVNGAPAQLDTLGEIADSLGNDATFSTTMTNALALKDTIVDVNTKDANTLSSANSYTDTSIAAIPATDLSAYSTTVQVEALPVSTFTNDAGYITSSTDSQTLSFANPNLTISNGNVVDLSSLTPTVPVTSVNTLIGAVVLDTDNINEGSTNLYHTTPRVQSVINTNSAGFLDASALTPYSTTVQTAALPISTFTNDLGFVDNAGVQVVIGNNTAGFVTASEVHIVTDSGTVPPKLSTSLGNNTFQFETTGTISSTLNMESFSNISNTQVHSLSFKTAAQKKIVSFEAFGAADNGNNITNYTTFWGSAGSVFQTRDTNTGAARAFYLQSSAITLQGGPINFNNAFTFPQVDGTVDQVLTTNGSGQVSWQDGGGGSVALSDLTDVAELNLQNNDLLMYNSTASEWQNTNLGISVTPTLTGNATPLTGTPYTLTVTNHATYDDPAYFCEIYDSNGIIVIQNSSVVNNYDGTLVFVAPGGAAANYQIRLRVQDFGDLQSEIAIKAITTVELGGNYRYWRIANFTGLLGSMVSLTDLRFYDAPGGASGTGTKYPSFMTSNVLPTPFIASASYTQSATYEPFKAFNSNPSDAWWNLSSPNGPANDTLTVDFGQPRHIKSMFVKYWIDGLGGFRGADIEASNTGAFAGEEVTIVTFTGLFSAGLTIG